MHKNPNGNVLVLGSINMDVVTPIDHIPLPGQTIMAGDVQLIPGGKGANAAVAAARLGGNVRMIGCVGDDAFGNTLKTNLQHERIDCNLISKIAKQSSGTAVILLDTNTGQNSIMVSSGANDKVTAPQDQTLYQWANVMMMQLETPIASNIDAAKYAKANGVTLILDPAPAVENLPPKLFELCDILLPNETELATLTNMPVESMEQLTAAANKFLAHANQHIIVTLGSRGALWVTDNHVQHFQTHPLKPIDTTAAGDSFAGALASKLATGNDIAQSMPFALAAGSLACTKIGAQPSVPTFDEVQTFMKLTLD